MYVPVYCVYNNFTGEIEHRFTTVYYQIADAERELIRAGYDQLPSGANTWVSENLANTAYIQKVELR